MNDDEEHDEDYVPTADVDDYADDEELLVTSSVPTNLNSLQVTNVDKAFERLFGYKWGTEFHFDDESSLSTAQRILVRCLGPTAAASICQTASTTRPKRTVHRKAQHYKSTNPRSSSGTTPASNRTSGARSSGTTSTSAPPASGVDAVLASLEAPAKLSTVAKTSKDWDQFKETSGLGTKLEEGADSKQAYLKRQDFLQRVDGRQFEKERQERDRERAKRGK